MLIPPTLSLSPPAAAAATAAQVSFRVSAGGKPATPEQAVLMVSSRAHPALAAYIAAKRRADGAHAAALTAAAIERQVGKAGGDFTVTLLLGDAAAPAGLRWELGELSLPSTGAPAKLATAASGPAAHAKPEIVHLQRAPERMPPAAVSWAFTAAVLAPLGAVLAAMGGFNLRARARAAARCCCRRTPPLLPHAAAGCCCRRRARMCAHVAACRCCYPRPDRQGWPSGSASLWAAAFHAGLAAMLGLYAAFWLKLNLLQTLPLAAGLGVCVAGAGYKALSALADARLKKD